MHQGGGARGASHTQHPRRTETRRLRPRRVWFGRMAGFLRSGFNADERRGFGVGRGDSLGELCCRESQGEVGCREGGRAAHARCRVVQQGRRMGVGHGGCWSPVFEWGRSQGLCGPPEGAALAREQGRAGLAGGPGSPWGQVSQVAIRVPSELRVHPPSRVVFPGSSRALARPSSRLCTPLCLACCSRRRGRCKTGAVGKQRRRWKRGRRAQRGRPGPDVNGTGEDPVQF